MENWLIFALGLILGIPLSIFANIITPWIKSYFQRRSLSVRERRIFILVNRYRSLKEIKGNVMLLNLLISKTILLGLLLLTVPFGIIAIFMAYDFWGLRIDSAFFPLGLIISLFMVFGFYFLGIFVLLSIFKDINDVMDFERYKEKMSRKLIKLGIDPIELEDVNITLNLGRHHLGKLKW